MRAVIQRVSRASVVVNQQTTGSIAAGLLIFLGVGREDGAEDVAWLVGRITKLRIFEDGAGRMQRSLLDTGGEALVISQFTLYGSLKKGNRPSFNRAALPECTSLSLSDCTRAHPPHADGCVCNLQRPDD